MPVSLRLVPPYISLLRLFVQVVGGLKVGCTHVSEGHHRARGRICECWYGPSKLNISLWLTYHQAVFFSPYSLKDEGRRTFSFAVHRLFRSPERKKERLITNHFMVKMFGFNEKRIILAGVYQVNQYPEQILLLCNQHHPQPSLFPPAF